MFFLEWLQDLDLGLKLVRKKIQVVKLKYSNCAQKQMVCPYFSQGQEYSVKVGQDLEQQLVSLTRPTVIRYVIYNFILLNY